MGLEERLPSGLLLTTAEKMGGYARKSSGVAGRLRRGMSRYRAVPAGGARHFAAARAHVPGVDAAVSSDAARHENTRSVTRQPTGGRSGMS